MKLGDIIDIKVGLNSSRLTTDDVRQQAGYTYDDLQVDLGSGLSNQESLEIVTSLVGSQISAIISEVNQAKVLNQNFARINMDATIIDPYYLCYLLNESHDIMRQKEALKQGSTLPKITPQIIKELQVSLPPIEQQQKIGRIYYLANQQYQLMQQNAQQQHQAMMRIINTI
ncbi:restriction endonuclease subunit S [Periweissella fabaria]|uniref:Type I restriction modification DNA specificity domain-containing protein n=1 Tax=Periweissella fabaria TaxID=546157 RepID=A0ABN8BFW5_9LACO|nr:restriction endonuclease subunit S [Periweissella fabaria]MCM0596394.1 restriction endonuclease subunit S [Periweissella fabaria]CAH0415878.1 hypothetical protein WFA24289_00176 [Periweissella fabaria]